MEIVKWGQICLRGERALNVCTALNETLGVKTQCESIDVICNRSGSILLQMIGQLFKFSQH